jgi:hypothetical protein
MINSSNRWTPSFLVPQWYDAVASPYHLFFSWPRSRRRDLTGRPLSSPVLPPPDRSTDPYLSWFWMTIAIPWRHKGKPSRSFAIAKSHLPLSSTVPSLFVLSPANFGQPPPARLYRLFRSSMSKLSLHLCRQPPEEARKKIKRRNQTGAADYGSTLGVVRALH